jgi:hypothetical protein
MKSLSYLLILYILVSSCGKDRISGDLSGKEYIRGRLFLTDTITQNSIGLPLGKKRITLSYAGSTDTLNHLFSTTTDDEGYFLFNNLRGDKLYSLYYEEKIGQLTYIAKDTVKASTASKVITAQLVLNKQNGLYLTVVDAQNNKLNNAQICVFSSPFFYNTGSCDASSFKMTTDDYGRASKFNIPNGIYYIITSKKANDFTFIKKDTISVEDTVVTKIIKLHPEKLNGFSYVILDTLGSPVSGANICVFTSQVLFNADSCIGNNFQVISDINGVAKKTQLQQGTYFIYGTLKIGNVIWSAKDTLHIREEMVFDTLILRKK